jgi:signal transduction histidine kinase
LNADRAERQATQFSFQNYTKIFELIDSILIDLKPQIEKNNVKVIIERRQVPELYIDVDKMRLVFQNLLENAVKYTIKGGSITIRSDINDGALIVSVSDTGIGIPRDQQGNIFQRFYRASNAKLIQTDGSGLGLFLVRKIVEAHRGKAWFESLEGKGTIFYIQLPLRQ